MMQVQLMALFRAQLAIIVEGFFTLNQDIAAFKNHMRDFLVQCKVCCLLSLR